MRGAVHASANRSHTAKGRTAGLLRDRHVLRRVVRVTRRLQILVVTVILFHRRVNFAGDRVSGCRDSVQTSIFVTYCCPDR